MEEKKQDDQVVEIKEEVTETSTKAKPAKKINGDARTFVIALLTSIIVVLIYHGIIVGIRCIKGDCRRQQPAAAGECQMPQRPQCRRPQRPACSDAEQCEAPRRQQRQHHHRRRQQRQDGERRRPQDRSSERPAPAAAEAPAPTTQESGE